MARRRGTHGALSNNACSHLFTRLHISGAPGRMAYEISQVPASDEEYVCPVCVCSESVTTIHSMHSTAHNRHDKGPPHLH